MTLFVYGTVLQRHAGAVVTTSSTLGYADVAGEDEARGIAIRKAQELKPGFDIIDVTVLEVATGDPS